MSSHILSHLITPYHIFCLIFDGKVMLMITFNLVPDSLKRFHVLPHFIRFYHTLSNIVSHIWLKSSVSDKFILSAQVLSNVITCRQILSCLITPYHTLSPTFIFNRKTMSMRIPKLVYRFLKTLLHLATSYHVLSHLLTL